MSYEVTSSSEQCRPPEAKWVRRMLALSAAAAILPAALVLYFFIPIISRIISPVPDFPRLEAQGDALFVEIQRYHSGHGSYPVTLAEAGISNPKTRWGHWHYWIAQDGVPNLSVGDYHSHGFALYRDAKSSRWAEDQ